MYVLNNRRLSDILIKKPIKNNHSKILKNNSMIIVHYRKRYLMVFVKIICYRSDYVLYSVPDCILLCHNNTYIQFLKPM